MGIAGADLVMKQYDTRPFLSATLQGSTGAADLTTATSVRLVAKNASGTTVINQSSTMAGPLVTTPTSSAGGVQYQWQAADLVTPGIYYLEWQVTYADGTKSRFPNTGHQILAVNQALSS